MISFRSMYGGLNLGNKVVHILHLCRYSPTSPIRSWVHFTPRCLTDQAGDADVQYNGLISTEIVFVLVKYQIIGAPRENFETKRKFRVENRLKSGNKNVR
jgi:hypothetical protein